MGTSLKPAVYDIQNGELISNQLKINKEIHLSLIFGGQESLGAEKSLKSPSYWWHLLAKRNVEWRGFDRMEESESKTDIL